MLNGEEVFAGRNSPLLESFGCIDRTNVIAFLPSMDKDYYEAFDHLKDPCININVVVHSTRKIVQLDEYRNKPESEKIGIKTFTENEFKIFIEDLHQQQQQHHQQQQQQQQQVLLIMMYRFQTTNKGLRAIEKLERETDLNVMVICEIESCPILQDFPINHIFPVPWKGVPKIITGIVQNPDFERNEFLKYVKLKGNVNCKCLTNKTIHIFMIYLSSELLENSFVVVNNCKDLNIKFILYTVWNVPFWTNYIEKNGWKDMVKIERQRIVTPILPTQQNTKEVFLINDFIFYLPYSSSSENLCFPTRKSIVFFKFPQTVNADRTSPGNSSNWYNSMDEKCRKNFELVSYNDKYDSRDEFVQNFIEEVFKASCF